MELLEEKIDMPLLIYDTLDVCEESFFVLIMCLVKISTFHLRHLLKVDFDVCFLTCCIVGLSFLQVAIQQFKQFAPDIA